MALRVQGYVTSGGIKDSRLVSVATKRTDHADAFDHLVTMETATVDAMRTGVPSQR